MGASAAITLSYVGNGPSGGQQIIADQTSGPKAKTLYGYGTLVSGSDATTAPVYFIDGTQSMAKTIVLQAQSVDAPVTYLGTANVAFYHSVQGDGQIAVGDTVTIAGFSTSANNTTGTVLYVVTGAIGISNSSSVAETNPAATISCSKGGVPVWVNVFYAGNPASGDSSTAAVAFANGTNKFTASAVTAKGFTLNYPTVTTSGVTIAFGAVIAFSN